MSEPYYIYSNPHDAVTWIDATTEGSGANSPTGYEAANLARGSVVREFRSGETFGDGNTTELIIQWGAVSKPATPLRALLIQHTNVLAARLGWIPSSGGGWNSGPDEAPVVDLWGSGRILLTPPAPILVDDVRIIFTVTDDDVGLATLDGAPFWRAGAFHWFKNADACDWAPAGLDFSVLEPEAEAEYANGRRAAAAIGAPMAELDVEFDVATLFGDPGLLLRIARQSPVVCVDWPAPDWAVHPLKLGERAARQNVSRFDRESQSWVFRELVHDLETYGNMTDQPVT